MQQQWIQERIALGRSFITKLADDTPSAEGYETDQEQRKPQPPLSKPPMTKQVIPLPQAFGNLGRGEDFLDIVNRRKSHRVYTDESISLEALSFLLWCTQGVKEIRGRAYATIRTVPSGGARHPFECYLAIRKVEGLAPGLYHYLPLQHGLEYIGQPDDLEDFINESLCGQSWAKKAGVVFYYSCVFYRAEWRYGIWAHAPILMDSGHVTENLYLAATALGLGGCAVAAVEPHLIDEALGLDGKEETVFYAMPVGTVRPEDQPQEQAFYAFVQQQGL
ncbi:MAG: SagB/ThcOx family dehydrogenase [Clostridia bacterium]|nr:SagB/ThcOx family dehydrogenase [Clostridia bacterium]